MLSDLVIPSVEQCCVNIFLVKEKVKPEEILCRLDAQFGEETALCSVNIRHLRELFLGNRPIAGGGGSRASNGGVSVASKQLLMNTYCSRKCIPNGVPRILTFGQKAKQVAMSAERLHWFVLEGNTFLE
jgi:hypothetical protein